MGHVYIFDIEVYPNLFYAVFKELEGDNIVTFDHNQLNDLRYFLGGGLLLIGFNNRHYDSVILHAIFDGVNSTNEIYNISVSIINQTVRHSKYKKYLWCDHPWSEIDLKAIGLYGQDWSLKKHEIRLKMDKVEDLPYPFDTNLSSQQLDHVKAYCKDGDIVATKLLYDDFNASGVIDTASKLSDLYPFTGKKAFYSNNPKMGELILNTLYQREAGLGSIKQIQKPSQCIFNPNDLDSNIFFLNDANIEAWDYIKSIPPEKVVNIVDENRNIGVSEWRKKHLKDVRFKTGDIEFTIGVGGLHSTFYQRKVEGNLVDFDVSSYYPSIIKNNKRPPMGLSSVWLDIFSRLYDDRLQAKKAGDKAASNIFKLIINSAYGKSNSVHSTFFDPVLMMMTTLTGQLYLINRDSEVVAWVLNKANGICESCRNSAPFTKEDGTLFLEVHHLRRLADGGSDTITNAIAACPNCHRELHYGADKNKLLKLIYSKVERLIVE